MKLSAATIMSIATLAGIVAGAAKDRQSFKASVAAAQAANQPIPVFDWEAFFLHQIVALSIALSSGAAVATTTAGP